MTFWKSPKVSNAVPGPQTWMFNGRQHIKSESTSFLLSRVFVLHRLPSSVSGPQPAHVAEMLDLKKNLATYLHPQLPNVIDQMYIKV